MNTAAPAPTSNYLKTVFFLIFIDVIACFVPYLLPGPKPVYWLAVLIIHGGTGIWIGSIINWTFKIGALQKRLPVIGYWICFALSMISMGGPFILVQWIIAVIVVMQTSYADKTAEDNFFSRISENTQEPDRINKSPKGVWPFYISVLMLLASLAAILIIAMFDTSEFGGMAMFFGHMLITPFFIFIPALMRIPAAKKIKPAVVGIQMGIYVFIAFSWMVLLMRV